MPIRPHCECGRFESEHFLAAAPIPELWLLTPADDAAGIRRKHKVFCGSGQILLCISKCGELLSALAIPNGEAVLPLDDQFSIVRGGAHRRPRTLDMKRRGERFPTARHCVPGMQRGRLGTYKCRTIGTEECVVGVLLRPQFLR